MSRTQKLFSALAVFALLGLVAADSAKAVPVIAIDRTTLCGTPGNCANNITFEGSTTGLQNSITQLGVTFSIGSGRSNAGVEIIDGFNVGAPGTNVLTAGGDVIGVLGGLNNIELTLLNGTTAFGFDLKSGNTTAGSQTGGSYEIYLNGALFSTVVIPTYSAFGFFGVSGLDPNIVNMIAIRAIAGGEPVLDNVTFGPTSVPEPASMVLLGTGLIGIASAIRKRRHPKVNADESV
jgi:PEP-CTERM motif-containing protein